jgi:hypothetical protein
MNSKKEITGGELTDYPNEKYRQFFDKFAEIETLDITNWKPVHLIGYFCKKYQEQYQTKYQFKFNSPSPTKCFEVFQIKKLAMLLSSNSTILKEYIDWVFLTKVVQAKRRLTSISFMTHEGLVQDYKLNILLKGKKNLNVDRSTALPDKYRNVFGEIGINIGSYGELAFLAHMTQTPQMTQAFQKIEELGFDKEVLERIV